MEIPNRPHTLTGLYITIAIVVRAVLQGESQKTLQEDVRTGLFYASFVFLVYIALQLQDGEVTRPHPVIWRLIHGITMLYLMFIVFLITLSSSEMVDSTVQLIVEPRAGSAPLAKFDGEEYNSGCTLNQGNIMSKVYDIFFFAHLFGWIIKALILRDWGMMWTCSLLFEVMEITLQKVLPNFAECYWDRWVLDIFGCNLVGMYLGMKLSKWMGRREYDWSGKFTVTTKKGLVEGMKILTHPRVFPQRLEWHAFTSYRLEYDSHTQVLFA